MADDLTIDTPQPDAPQPPQPRRGINPGRIAAQEMRANYFDQYDEAPTADVPAAPPATEGAKTAPAGNHFDQYDTEPDAGEAGLAERWRLNQSEGYYRGSIAGSLELFGLSQDWQRRDRKDYSAGDQAWVKARAEKYETIINDLSRYDALRPWGTTAEGAAALTGQLVGGLQSPESFLGWGAKGVNLAVRTGKAALQQGAIQAATDPVVQALDIAGGVQPEGFDPKRTAYAFGIGAIIGGGLHVGGELISSSTLKAKRAELAVEDPSLRTASDGPAIAKEEPAPEPLPPEKVREPGADVTLPAADVTHPPPDHGKDTGIPPADVTLPAERVTQQADDVTFPVPERVTPAGETVPAEHATTPEGRPVEVQPEPRVLTFEQFAAENGAGGEFVSEPGMHQTPGGMSEPARKAALERLATANAEHAAKREQLRTDYQAAVDRGEIRPPTRREELEQIAAGHDDNPSVQAARRVLAKMDAIEAPPEVVTAPDGKPTEVQPEVVAPAPEPTKGPRGRDPATYSLFEYLASRGGLAPSPDLAKILDGNPFVPGFGRLIRKNGMSIDKAWEATARDARYLNDVSDRTGGEALTTANDLLRLIEEEHRGAKQYQLGAEGTKSKAQAAHEAEANRVQIERALDDHLAEAGLGDIDPALHKRAVQIMEREGVSDPDVALERAAMQDADRYEKLAKARTETTGEIPGWDAAEPRAAPGAGAAVQQPGPGLEPGRGGAGQGVGEGTRGAGAGAEPLAPAERFEIGKSLTKEQRKEVLGTLVDVYKENRLEKELKGVDKHGNEIWGYPYTPELFRKSNITSAPVRYYVVLPDGRIAHPTELFPNYTQRHIDAEMARRDFAAKQNKITAKEKVQEGYQFDTLDEAATFWDRKSEASRAQTAGGWPAFEPSVNRVPFTDGKKIALINKRDAANGELVEALADIGWKRADTKATTEAPATAVIHDDVVAQLTRAGMGAEEAQANAAVVAARYQARGERLGEDPLALYRGEGIEVRQGADAEMPSGDRVYNQSVALRKGGGQTLKKYGLDPEKAHNVRQVAEALERWARKKFGLIDRKDYSDKASNRIADWMAEEVKFEMQPGKQSGAGWYSTKFQTALDHFGEIHPELKRGSAEFDANLPGLKILGDKQSARDFLTALIAVSSDGQKVAPNFRFAVGAYGTFRDTGKLPTEFSFGADRNKSIKINLANIQRLIDERGPQGMKDFLLQETTVTELAAQLRAQGQKFDYSERADTKLPTASVVFGPKLGAFYANLMGGHGYLTMDRWWSRTFNRYRGTLIPKVSEKGLERFRQLIGEPGLSDEEAIARTVEHAKAFEARGYKNGTEIEKAAKTIYKDAFVNLQDEPFNASDRAFMRETVERARQKLEAEEGVPISTADIQAILWYYEKRLYGELGARQSADISYEDVAKQVADQARPVGPAEGDRPAGPGNDRPREAAGRGEVAVGERNVPTEIQGPDGSTFETRAWRSPLDGDLYQRSAAGEARGRIALSDNKAVIELFGRANQSTFMHEAGHLWLDELSRDAKAKPELAADFKTVLDWLGVQRAENIGTAQHEQWARGFEQYLSEGRAPSSKLQAAFEKFKRWLSAIYHGLTDAGSQLSDDVRGVMDRMLATDRELAARGPTAEPGAEGKPQLVLPGAERITDAQLAQRRADERLRPTATQRPMDEGLFGEGHKQDELFARPAYSDAATRDALAAIEKALGEAPVPFNRQSFIEATMKGPKEAAQYARAAGMTDEKVRAEIYQAGDSNKTSEARYQQYLAAKAALPDELAAIAQRQSGTRLPAEQARPAGGVAASPQQAAAVRSLQQQAQDFADVIGFPLRQGRVTTQGAIGAYKQRAGVVRVDEVPDFEVVAHEAGHAIEAKVGPTLTNLTNAHAAELAQLVSNPAAYAPALHVMEGFAEYVRRYIGNPAAAAHAAPGFTTAFRNFLEAGHPEIIKALDNASAAYRAYLNAPSVDAVGAVRRSKAEEPRGIRAVVQMVRENGLGGSVGNVFKWAYTSFLDRDAPLARVQRDLLAVLKEQGGNLVDLKPSQNPEMLQRLFARSEQAGVRDMLDGVRPYRGVNPQGPSLSAAVAKATGQPSFFGRWDAPKVADFSNYLIARRAEYLWRKFDAGLLPNPPTAFSKADALQAMRDFELKNPTFRDGSDMVHDWTRELLTKMRDGHLIGAELHDKLQQEEFYVPFYRDMSDKPNAAAPGSSGRERTADVVKGMKGSARDIKDPIESLMLQSFLVNRAIRHNDVILALRDLARQAKGEGGRFVEDIPAHEARKYTFDMGEAIERRAIEKGMSPQDAKLLADSTAHLIGEDPLMGSFFRMEPANPRGEPIVFYKEGGEIKAARLMAGQEGHALYETITAMPEALADVSLQILSATSSTLRAGITTNPVYALTNYFKDQLAVSIIRPDYLPVYSGLKGIKAEFAQSQAAQLYGYAGGVSAGAAVAPIKRAAKAEINALARRGYVTQKFSTLGGFLEFTQFTEAGTRNSVFDTVYKGRRAQGLSEYEAMIEAAYSAQDTLDFSRWGSKTLAVRALTPFINSQLQGLDKLYRTMIEPLFRTALTTADKEAQRNAVVTATKFFGVSGALGMGWAALHYNDDIYKDASPQMKGTHFVTTSGGKLITIPKPYELALGFTAGEYAYALLMKNDPRAAEQFAKAAYDVLMPSTPIFANPLIKVSSELYLNRSFFTGRDIVPERLQRGPTDQQYTDRTSYIAKTIGNVINVAPIKVDHAIGGYFGLWGRDVMALSQGIEEDSPTAAIEDHVFLRRFIKDPTRTSDVTSKFWDYMSRTTGKYNQANNGYMALVGRRSPEGDRQARQFLAKLPESERVSVILKSAANPEGKPAFTADERRLHPLHRAYDAVTVLNGVRQELVDNNFHTYEDGDRFALSQKARGDLRDATRELAQKEMRNAFVIMKEPGYEGRALLGLDDTMAKIRSISPGAADEIAARYANKKIYPTAAIAKNYNALKREVLRGGSDADVDRMLGDAQAAGFEFGADRVKRPQRRRITVPGNAPPSTAPAPLTLQ